MSTIISRLWQYRLVILVVLWLIYIINYFDRFAVLIFLPYIQEDLNLTAAQAGWLASTFFFAYALAQVSAGYLADRFGPKKVMYVAIVAFTLVTGLTGLVRSFWQFIALRIGLGLGAGHHFAPAVRNISNWFPTRERGQATSFFATSWAVAPIIVPVIITSISAYFFEDAWRPVFFLLAIPGFLGIFLLWYFISDWPQEMLDKGRLSNAEYEYIRRESLSMGEQAQAEEMAANRREGSSDDETPIEEENRQGYGLFLRDPYYYLYVVALFCQIGIYWGTATWLSTFLVDQHGMDLTQMGFFASAPYIFALIATLLGGFLMDRVFNRMRPVALIAYLGSIPSLFILGTIGDQPALLLTMLLISAFFANLNFGSIYAYLQKRYPKEVVGSAAGLSNGIGQLGAFIAPLTAGYLVTVGAGGTQNFGNVFAFFAALAALAAICSFFLREDRPLPSERRVRTGTPVVEKA
jgi:sugar phosphate permease